MNLTLSVPRMDSEDGRPVVDLYADLPDVLYNLQLSCATDELGKATQAVAGMKEQLRSCETTLDLALSQNKILIRNLSVLFSTAKAEIERKDSMIDDLRQEVTSLRDELQRLRRPRRADRDTNVQPQ
ncbi:Biogenesis of lysosome-related organelles complex 1 subunit 7 [Plasmodiophora brassicae]|uniref:Uncharacterized protein n=1 Tax=Plasmodiophora brassicae TaxID=37360 RepID=A0A0G4IP43_PLABS|nr:hypothetical protein PBRA_005625 [Plasmodiophora brassicae]SPR01002.1 unnamed protein product [Plasmodiophora brassicae]